jgi:hypothetical protein
MLEAKTILLVQETLEREVVQEDGTFVWPEGTMERLQAQLNPPQKSLMDHVREAESLNKRVADFEAALPTMSLDELYADKRSSMNTSEQCRCSRRDNRNGDDR